MNYQRAYSKLGGTRNLFVAGSDCDERERFDRIDLADAVVGEWTEDVSHLWWGDVAYAAGKGKPVYTGTCGEDAVFLYSTALSLCRLRGATFSHCDSFESLNLLATLFSLHDPKCTARSPMGRGLPILNILNKVESPIEARLLVHLACPILEDTFCNIEPQRKEGRYRLDFAVTNEGNVEDSLSQIRIAIECDGHDYHERTKEQAARDRSRDRELTADGWQVMRFTGSEIWKDPGACAAQIRSLIEGHGGTF